MEPCMIAAPGKECTEPTWDRAADIEESSVAAYKYCRNSADFRSSRHVAAMCKYK
jgi:hypothetical protein